MMKKREEISGLDNIPNVGPATVSYLKSIGINKPSELPGKNPYKMFQELESKRNKKFDPCLLDIFISAVRYMEGEPEKQWWSYTAERKKFMKLNQ